MGEADGSGSWAAAARFFSGEINFNSVESTECVRLNGCWWPDDVVAQVPSSDEPADMVLVLIAPPWADDDDLNRASGTDFGGPRLEAGERGSFAAS